MKPIRKHIAKPVKPLFDPAAFYHDFYDETVVKSRMKDLKRLGMDEIRSKRGWIGYELPHCSWNDHHHHSHQVSNYRCWPAEAHGWIVQVINTDNGSHTCMLRRKAVTSMPDREWEVLMNKVEHIRDEYPLLDENDHSNLESELQDKEWAETYREEFQKAMAEKFDGVFETLQFGDRIQRKFEEMINDDGLTDDFFWDYIRNNGNGEEWSEDHTGDWGIDIDRIVSKIDTHDVTSHLWPEDPRQLKFKFMQAEAIVKEMLNDDLMVMVESPNAARIVDRLLETSGPHSFSCLMINLPEEMANQLMAWGKLNVKDEDVFVDKKGGKGREDEPHVTVLYGLLDENPSNMLQQVFENTAPFDIKLGPCSLFKNDDFDVLKMEVISPFLHALNRNVRSVAAYENDYPVYQPHVTIAYVKPGTCDRLEGASPWDDPEKLGVTKLGQEGVFKADKVVYSSMNGKKTTHDLGTNKVGQVTAESWESGVFEKVHGRKPIQEGELKRWVREASQVYYQTTGKIAGFRKWMESNEDEMAEFVAGSGALDTVKQASHRTIRRIIGKHIVDRVEIDNGLGGAKIIGPWPGAGTIRIVYKDNGRTDSPNRVWTDTWASFGVLKWSLRNWRNLYGARLFVNGDESGVVSFNNPALADP